VSAATARLDRVLHHRHPYSLRGAHARRSFRCRGDAARNPSGQKRGDELSRTTRSVLSRDVGFRPPAGGLRKGGHHRPDHQQSICGRGDRIDLEQACDRCRQARQRPERRGRGACTSDQLGSGHAQSARRRRRGTLPRAARLQGPSDHVELARPVPRHRGRFSVLGMGAGPGSADLHPSSSIRRGYRSGTTSRWINTSSTNS
jgi:hypothetical protein